MSLSGAATDGPADAASGVSWPRIAALLGGAAVGTIGLAVLFNVDPARVDFLPRCPFHSLTGLHCPGCGSTRALFQLCHGRISAAFAYNPLVPLLLPYVVVAGLDQAFRWAGVVRRPAKFVDRRWIWGLLAAILLFTILRNIPGPPFDQLVPHATP